MKHLYRRVYTYYDFYLKRGIPATLAKYFSIKEKTKFSNVDNFYKGKFPSLSDFFISLHTLARWIFASMPKLPKYNTENAGMIHSKSQVDEINRTLQSIFDTYLTYYSPQWRMCIWLGFFNILFTWINFLCIYLYT